MGCYEIGLIAFLAVMGWLLLHARAERRREEAQQAEQFATRRAAAGYAKSWASMDVHR